MTFVAASIGNFLTSPEALPGSWRIAVLALGQLVFWAPLLASGVWLRHRDAVSQSPLVLAALALGLLLRAVLVSGLLDAMTDGPTLGWPMRLATSMLNIAPVFGWTAYIVSIMRERRRQVASLHSLRSDLERSVELVASGVRSRNEETIDRVRTRLIGELSALDGHDAHGSLALLQRTASDVVRPMSRELADALPPLEFSPSDAAPERVAWTAVLDHAASGRPFRPLVIAVLMCMPILGGVLLDPRAAVGAALTVLSLFVFFAIANVAVGPLLGRWQVETRVVVLVACAMLAAALAGLVAWASVTHTSSAVASGVGIFVASTVVSLGAAVITALGRDRDSLIGQLEESSQALKRNLVRWRQMQWFQQKALSRALHGPVQTAVNAAALRLDEALQRGDVAGELVDEVRGELLQTLDVLHSPEATVVPLQVGIDRIIGTWDGVCDVDVRTEPAVELILDDDPPLRSCLLDILTDDVGAAVTRRKSTWIGATMTFDLDRSVVCLEVTSNGAAAGQPASTSRSPASLMLDDCALSWSRSESRAGHALSVLLPVP